LSGKEDLFQNFAVRSFHAPVETPISCNTIITLSDRRGFIENVVFFGIKSSLNVTGKA